MEYPTERNCSEKEYSDRHAGHTSNISPNQAVYFFLDDTVFKPYRRVSQLPR